MFLNIVSKIELEYKNALNYFPLDYINQLNSKESIVSRFLISKEVENTYKIHNYFPKFDENKIPLSNNGIFWSISHKGDLVFIWIDINKIWIDVEIYKERDKSLLDQFSDEEYNIFWWKNWVNFYIIWTAKECVIKYNLLNLNNLNDIKIKEIKNVDNWISNLIFSKKIVLKYKTQTNQVYFGRKDDIFYSVCSNIMLEW